MYRVTWTFDVDADSPLDAARKAFEVVQRQGTTANCFEVYEDQGLGERTFIDLMDTEQDCLNESPA